jgi:hypothetical protein
MLKQFLTTLKATAGSRYTTVTAIGVFGLYLAYRAGYIPEDVAVEAVMLGQVVLGLLAKDGHRE